MFKEVNLNGHAVGRACLNYGFCYRAGFIILTRINNNPSYSLLLQEYPFISKYVIDSVAFAIGFIMI